MMDLTFINLPEKTLVLSGKRKFSENILIHHKYIYICM